MTPVQPRILLKARPTVTQLADRMEPPRPDGMELYIHEADISGDDWFDTLAARLAGCDWPPDFTWIVEGPVWSLDGELFGLCRQHEADRELTRRLVRLASHLGAAAVNIHCVDGSPDAAVLSEAQRRRSLDRAFGFLTWYARLCLDAGVTPLIENVPPICRMRRAAFIFTPIGVEARDLLACAAAVRGLGVTLDTSHAQLAVNAFRGSAVPEMAAGEALSEPAHRQLKAAATYYLQRSGPETLAAYVEEILPLIVSVHVSNAAGLLDEGLPYEHGEANLDSAVAQLASVARYFVTEPLDPDEEHAVLKRQMQRRLAAVLRPPTHAGALTASPNEQS